MRWETTTLGGEIIALTTFIHSTFANQDKVIVNIKEGQKSLDNNIVMLAISFGQHITCVMILILD